MRLVGRHGLPETGAPGSNGLTRQQVYDDMAQRNVTDKASTYRPKGETTEERAERKKAVKAERKVCISSKMGWLMWWIMDVTNVCTIPFNSLPYMS